MSNMKKETIWIDVIEDVPAEGCNTSTIRLNEPLQERETMREWLEAHGFCDIVDFRVVVGDWVMSWGAPELEWFWIQNMTEPFRVAPPPHN